MIIFEVILTLLSIAYPILFVFKNEYALEVVLFLAILWGIKGIMICFKISKGQYLIAFGFCIVFLIIFFSKNDKLVLFYPVFINLIGFLIFFFSLKQEAIITKIARLSDGQLDKKGVSYTRNITKIWCGVFAMNAIISIALSNLDNKSYWGIYNGIISYVIIGTLISGEWVYRKMVLKK